MKLRRPEYWLLAGVSALFLTGCIWLRLLEFKNQLGDFDRYVKVEDQNGLTFRFLKPVLLADDIHELTSIDPTTKATNQNLETWFWTFEKQFASANTGDHTKDMTFLIGFTNGKMDALTFPERALAVLPKPLVLGMFRSLGGAEIDQKKRSATIKWQGGPEKNFIPLTKTQITGFLGAPFSITESNLSYTYLYKYNLKTVSRVPAADRRVRAIFTLASETDTTTRLEGDFAGLHFYINFEPPPKPSKR